MRTSIYPLDERRAIACSTPARTHNNPARWLKLALAGTTLAAAIAISSPQALAGDSDVGAELAYLPSYQEDLAAYEAASVPSSDSNGNSEEDLLDAALEQLDNLEYPASPEQVLEALNEQLAQMQKGDNVRGGPTATGYTNHLKWSLGNTPGFGQDQFFGAANGMYRGRSAARLANGDVVVVGDIQGTGVSAAINLGMVRYNSRGQRVRWTSAGSVLVAERSLSAISRHTGLGKWP